MLFYSRGQRTILQCIVGWSNELVRYSEKEREPVFVRGEICLDFEERIKKERQTLSEKDAFCTRWPRPTRAGSIPINVGIGIDWESILYGIQSFLFHDSMAKNGKKDFIVDY